jgi:hypothetical protein
MLPFHQMLKSPLCRRLLQRLLQRYGFHYQGQDIDWRLYLAKPINNERESQQLMESILSSRQAFEQDLVPAYQEQILQAASQILQPH